jgi:hypothetical protein
LEQDRGKRDDARPISCENTASFYTDLGPPESKNPTSSLALWVIVANRSLAQAIICGIVRLHKDGPAQLGGQDYVAFYARHPLNTMRVMAHVKVMMHFVRKPHPRRARTKNEDAQIACLRRHVSHYKVIGDARPGASPISIHWRRVKSECISDLIPDWAPMALIQDVPKVACLPLLKNPIHALSYYVADLIAGWSHCDTNRRCIILDARLLFDAPSHGHSGCRLHPGASQDLAAALLGWRSHIQQHTHT